MKKYIFEIFRDKKREFRWRIKSRNGKIIASSGEGFKRKRSIFTALDALTNGILTVKDSTL
jgi:uncharacterized protein YegP (UPF0339 family)